MKLILAMLCAACWLPIAALGCEDDVGDPLIERFRSALEARDAKDFRGAESALRALKREEPESFCIAYAIARLYAIDDRFEDAIEELETFLPLTLGEATRFETFGETPWNTMGFCYIRLKEFEFAESVFRLEMERPAFEMLPDEKKVKLYNNMGLTLMNLGQYGRSRDFLDKALFMKSDLAKYNLRVLGSIEETLTKKDESIPGVFATVVQSVRGKDRIDQFINSNICRNIKDATRPILQKEPKLYVFQRPDGMYHVTLDAYVSYLRAQRLQRAATASGVSDAYITSVENWANVTDQFDCE